jgi:condensin complex subunit 1
MCKESQKQNQLDSTRPMSKTPSTASSKSKKRKSIRPLNSNDNALEEEMGLQGAEAEDAELMFVDSLIDQKLAQTQTHGPNSMLAQLLPAVVHVLKEPLKYSDDTLQLACSLALVKLMLLSPRICNQYLQLLFTLVEKSNNPLVRSQLIIGIGDLVYRFPNALEPWTSHLYLPLRDTKSVCVRMNTIRVLSHLILKEMIKTRGQIYEIALCTIDPDEKICTLAKAFFQELALRNNGLVIYNAMPDIISQLSGGECSDETNRIQSSGMPSKLTSSCAPRKISEDSFRIIVTFLFSFIKRDKQCETLIEKLCHAFRQANTSERKCRDLVFCLSKIQLSEGGIKKLKETFKWYADKLCIPAVYETFKQTILKNARKLNGIKNETKLLIDELEKQIEEIKQKGLNENNEQTDNNEETAGDSETNNEEDENVPPPKQIAAKKRANTKALSKQNVTKSNANFKKKRGTRQKVVTSSSESESDAIDSDRE